MSFLVKIVCNMRGMLYFCQENMTKIIWRVFCMPLVESKF